MKAIDLTGQRFGKLLVLRKSSKQHGHGVVWVCRCDCGNTIEDATCHLRGSKARTSCGCLHEKHGDHKDRLYNIWAQMKNRCSSPGNDHYDRYGGRGISVCAEWEKYSQFKWWAILAGYRDELTIDRINNDGNYEPENCRWVTTKENNRNRGCVKLDPATVSEIKRLLLVERRRVSDVARLYGRSRTLIHNIKTGLKWKDINASPQASA